MRFVAGILIASVLTSTTHADPSHGARVIDISKDNAERSAAIIAASKSPLIGMPPPGKVLRSEPEWRNARAELPPNNTISADAQALVMRLEYLNAERPLKGAARVEIIKPGKAGPVVETYLVPRHGESSR